MNGLARRPALLADQALNEIRDLRRAEWLRQVVVGAGFRCARAFGDLVTGSHEDDHGPVEARIRAEAATQPIAVDARHHHIDEQGVRDGFHARSECSHGARRLRDREFRTGQRQTDEESQVRLIVNDQDSNWVAQICSSLASAGLLDEPSPPNLRRAPEHHPDACPSVRDACDILHLGCCLILAIPRSGPR